MKKNDIISILARWRRGVKTWLIVAMQKNKFLKIAILQYVPLVNQKEKK
ncbi:hypothetical protein [Saccharococcus caldoxylosilyticus]|nr:hypothetical protein [Parageobacillus caldoxylosilyticus]MBB3854545.1 hypothetical protein [Parageobacillus caldoxylosilyticus]